MAHIKLVRMREYYMPFKLYRYSLKLMDVYLHKHIIKTRFVKYV